MSGVRSSWLTFARKCDFARPARSAWRRASSSQRLAEASVSTASVLARSWTMPIAAAMAASPTLLTVAAKGISSGTKTLRGLGPRPAASQNAPFTAIPNSAQHRAGAIPTVAIAAMGSSRCQMATSDPAPPL